MKRLIAAVICIQLLLVLCACGGGGKKTGTSTTPDETTPSEVITPELTTPEQTTTEPVTTPMPTDPSNTTEPYEPIYEDGGFTYKIDIKPYLQYICTGGSREYLLLANRKNPIGSYSPSDLVYISGSNYLLRRAAKEAFEAMRTEMQVLGVYDTYHTSTFRSHTYQNTLYNKYLAQEKAKYPHLSNEELMNIVDTYSARPGTSDHQTGLTLDFYPLTEAFENKKAFKYMKDNAHKFGFILRFPEGDTQITGYTYEPWHWRFVGREVATYIYEHGLTLEEYMAELDGKTLDTFPPTTPIPPVTKPTTTAPPTTEPPTTEPDTTEPDSTEPDTTEPDSTEPDSTEPDSTEPDSTEPDSTEPDSTESDSTEPDSTEPDSTEPDSTDSDVE